MKNKRHRLTCCLLFIIHCSLFIACSTPPCYEQQVAFPDARWPREGIAHLSLPVSDSLKYYKLILTLRNTDDYPFSNIYFFVTATAPNGQVQTDTVQYELADQRGNWLGKTGSHWCDHRLLYRSQVRFQQTGDYQFSIRHGMRADTLQGIGAVGLRVEDDRK